MDMSICHKMSTLIFYSLFMLFGMVACSKDIETPVPNDPVAACRDTLNPIVFVHGFLASGDTYTLQALRFASNGYCIDRMFAFDWNSVGGGQDNQAALDRQIDEVLKISNANQVILMGHSAGSNLCYEYLLNPERSLKVSHYVHLAGNPRAGPAGGNGEVPTLNIYSDADLIVRGGEIPGATNVRFENLDHYQVATHRHVFREFMLFLEGKEGVLDVLSEKEVVTVSGKAITFAENQPMVLAEIELFELDPETGFRKRETPDFQLIADEKGAWGPVKINQGMPYEFVLRGKGPGDRVIHYYKEGFERPNALVYLRGLPPPSSLAGILLSGLPRDDNQSVVAVFSSNQAVIHGRDSLYFEDIELSTANLSPASSSNIAFFLYDANRNSMTDKTIIPTYAIVPFLTGVDILTPTDPVKTFSISFNGRTQRIRNWKSDSDGVIVVVFD
jgi:hypothetical protein